MLLLVIAVPMIIYLYFLQWKTTTMYGDDLYMYKAHAALNTFSEKINLPGSFQKYRPVHGFSMHFLIEIFQKNVNGYYCFNIAIQVINSFLFALILNLFLKSVSLSLIAGLTIGLSRFSFFNITQLYNGGALEGLAITFFLAFLFYIIKAIQFDNDSAHKQSDIIKAILFANLSMYTHERYIVLLPFIVLLILIYPGLKMLSRKQKSILSLIAIASVCLNIFLKKEVYNLPFFVGTGGKTMSLSSSTPVSFFIDGLLSILGLNEGPDYLVGINFHSLKFFNQLLVTVLLIGFSVTFFIYFRKIIKSNFSTQEKQTGVLWIIPFLALLFVLLLVPAVLTIRLEQRWLQASYSIFILCFIIAFCHLPFKNNYSRNSAFFLFIILLLWSDFTYLHKGAGNIYMTNAEKIANRFEEAIDKGVIKPGTKNIYLWEKQKDINTENEIKWTLAEDYFFYFYQQQEKKLIFADSIYKKDNPYSNSFINFNKNTDQIIYMDRAITDITNDYLQDSLKAFSNRIHNLPN